jgi:hypothetical protein
MVDEVMAEPQKTLTLPQKPKVEAPPAPALPSSVTLEAPFGYIDGDGINRYWQQGFVETDPAKIADLIARQARLIIKE